MCEIATKLALEFVTALIPGRAMRRQVRIRMLQWRATFIFRRRIKPMVRRLRALGGKRTVRVGFLVMSDACFQMESVFDAMLHDKCFDPMIYVIPDMARGREYQEVTMSRTFKSLSEKYGDRVRRVLHDGRFDDVSAMFDICSTMNPYSGLTHKYYTIGYLTRRGVPIFFSKYYFEDGDLWTKRFYSVPDLGFLWRFYVENAAIRDFVLANDRWLDRNDIVRIVGNPKTDMLLRCVRRPRERKCIILAPHHSVVRSEDELNIGNFLDYSDFILTLPSRYPQIDWIFRPHPLLLRSLVLDKIWTEQEKEDWLRRMTSFANVTYQDGGDYFDAFVNSDAMIQDCGSFLPEYFFTGHPQCFVLRDEGHARRMFPTEWGRALLDNAYRAYSGNEILDFIETVVLRGDDSMRKTREEFCRQTLNVEYGSSADRIVSDIKDALGLEKQRKCP